MFKVVPRVQANTARAQDYTALYPLHLLDELPDPLRRFLKKNFPQLGSRSRADQNVPLGQLRVALQASFNRLHRFLAQGYPLLIHLAA